MPDNPMDRQCRATSKQSGQQCRRPAARGAAVCVMHGGAAPQVRAAAERRLEEQAAQAQLVALGQPVAVDPGQALLDLVHAKAGEVAWLRVKVREVADLDDQDLVWGRTRVKDGGDDYGTTSEARPNVWWTLLRAAEDQLATYATAALKAGVEERRVRLAERQGLLVADVVRAILADLHLSGEQQALVATVVPAQLRRLEAGGAA